MLLQFYTPSSCNLSLTFIAEYTMLITITEIAHGLDGTLSTLCDLLYLPRMNLSPLGAVLIFRKISRASARSLYK